MATITAGSVVEKAGTILQDVTNTRWPESELLGWLNDGQREVVKFKPDACIQSVDHSFAEGTKQTLPDDGIVFIHLGRNTAATSSKKVIRQINRRILDDQVPGWHAQDGTLDVEHYVYDPQDPKHFYVYPPAASGAQGELVYSASPTDCASTSSTIAVDDVYANTLLDYILYRAYLKDAEYSANDSRAQSAKSAFLEGLKLKESAESANEPA